MSHRIVCWLIIALPVCRAAPLYGFELSRVERSVVRIVNQSMGGTGSGTVINASGDVLTNHHVTNSSRHLFVISEFSGGRREARIIWEAPDKDLALIRASGLGLSAATLFSSQPEKGAPVFSVGYPGAADLGDLALDATVTSGILGRIFPSPRLDWNVRILQHDAEINSGNSGGPLFDNCGRVVGVNTAGPRETAPGINWSSDIAESIRLLRANGIDFEEDASPCVVATPSPPGSAGAGVDEQAKETAQEAQTQAEQATQAVEEVRQAGRLTNTLVALVAVVTLVALGLALRKPRRELLRAAGQVAEPLSRLVQPQELMRTAGGIAAPLSRLVRSGRTGIVLTGFDSRGMPVKIALDHTELDRSRGGFTVGRHPLLVDQAINDSRLSRRHARFSGLNGTVYIEDLNSSNGTRLNGTACPPFKLTEIQPGDLVDLGTLSLQVSK